MEYNGKFYDMEIEDDYLNVIVKNSSSEEYVMLSRVFIGELPQNNTFKNYILPDGE